MHNLTKLLLNIFQFLTPVRMGVIAVVGSFFGFVVMGDQGIYKLRRLIEMKHRLISERAALNDEIDRLSEERQLLSDESMLEMVIRSELGFIRPGEIVFEEKK